MTAPPAAPSRLEASRLARVRARIRALLARPKRKTWLLLGIGFATLLASTALVAFAPEPARRPIQRTAVPVASEEVALGRYSPELSLYGRVETPHAASLTALVSATVASLEAREGDRVDAGQVLVQLDETDSRLLLRRRRAELAEAEAELQTLLLAGEEDREVLAHQEQLHALAQDKVARHRQLRSQGTIAKETLNAVLQESHAQAIALSRQRNLVQGFEHRLVRAEAQRDRAAAAVAEAEAGLARCRIAAPFPGRITRIAVAPGELVSPGLAVAEIYDDTTLEIRVQIPTAHLPALRRALADDAPPTASIDFGAYRAEGSLVRLVGAVAEGQSGVDGLVRLNGNAAPPDLGRAVALRLELPPVGNVVAVPVQAVYGQRRLFLVVDGLLAGIDVDRLGETTVGGQQRLLVRADALQPGARILVSQLSNAVTGLRVTTEGDAGEEGTEEADQGADVL